MVLEGEDARHIATVLRMKAGEKITVCDFFNTEYTCEIEEARGAEVRLRVLSAGSVESEPPFPITLCMALPKGDKMDLIVQKAVELGVSEILPFTSAYTVVKPDERGKEKKRERWQKIAASAAEQSGRGRIPQVVILSSYQEALSRAAQADKALLFYENEHATTLRMALESGSWKTVSLVTGPEGGLDESEVTQAREAGLSVCTLGSRILRCETAPLCALSAVMYAAGEF